MIIEISVYQLLFNCMFHLRISELVEAEASKA